MMKILASALVIILGWAVTPIFAAPLPSIMTSAQVCDPNSPTHCVAPDASGNMPVTGTFTASLGGFTPSATGARMSPLSVTTSDSSGNLPTGTVVVVSNAGTTNPMFCNVNGVVATTSDQLITPNGGWFAFTIPSGVTTLHCIATGGSTAANGLGGAGLPTGTGGGSSGGGGGGNVNLTQILGAAPSATNPLWMSPATGATFPISAASLPLPTDAATQTTLAALLSAVGSPFQAGGSIGNTSFTVNPLTAANWGIGATGSAAPANAQLAGVSDGTNLRPWPTGGLGSGATTANIPAVQLYGSNGTTSDLLQVDANKNLKVVGAGLAQGASVSGQPGQLILGQVTTSPGTLNTGNGYSLFLNQQGGLLVTPTAAAYGGGSPFHFLSAASNNSTNIKSSAGTLLKITLVQTTTTLGDLRLYDTASAPTCSSATGVVANYAVQSNATSPGFSLDFGAAGLSFTNGIGICLTGAVADNDNTNFVTGVQVNGTFK